MYAFAGTNQGLAPDLRADTSHLSVKETHPLKSKRHPPTLVLIHNANRQML
jgi:hypothetical protein